MLLPLDPVTEALLASCSSSIDEVLARHLPPGAPVALLNFPNHSNPGDSAIWLGAKAALARIGARIAYEAAWDTLQPELLARRLPAGTILLNGGGNLGDLYAGQQGVREEVLTTFTEHPVLQLPQSMWFEDEVNLERNRALLEGHGDVVLLLREEASFERATAAFDVPVERCCDLALALPHLPVPGPPTVPILWLGRQDPETVADAAPMHPDVLALDWLQPLPGDDVWPAGAKRAWEVRRRLGPRTAGMRGGQRWRALAIAHQRLGEAWVARGVEILSRGSVVVTDRLHGHVLCLLAGIPHVVLDNKTAKVSGVLDTWTGSSPLVHRATDAAEALEIALDLAAEATR